MQVNALRDPTRRAHDHACTVPAAKQPVLNAGDGRVHRPVAHDALQLVHIRHAPVGVHFIAEVVGPTGRSSTAATIRRHRDGRPLQGGRRLTSGFVSFYWASVFTPCTSKSRTLS